MTTAVGWYNFWQSVISTDPSAVSQPPYLWVSSLNLCLFLHRLSPLTVPPLSPALPLLRSPCCLINKLRPLWFWSMGLVCLGPVSLSSTPAWSLVCVCVFFFRARGFQLRDNASAHQTLLLPPPSLLLPRELKLAGSLPLSAAITAHTGAPEHTQAHTHTHPLCTVLPFFHRSSLTPDLPV